MSQVRAIRAKWMERRWGPRRGAWLWAAMVAMAVGPALGEEFEQDFRDGQFDRRLLALIGQNVNAVVRLEKGGMRIKQPDGSPALSPVGCSPRFQLRGDFEITVWFEILHLEQPKDGYGNGFTLRIRKDGRHPNTATLARFLHPRGGDTFASDHARTKGTERTHDLEFFPTRATVGKACLRRTGASLHYLVTEEKNGAWRELRQADFGTEDVGFVEIGGVTGGAACGLDLRIVQVSFTADSLPLKGESKKGVHVWVWWAVGNGIAVCLVCYLAYRRARRATG